MAATAPRGRSAPPGPGGATDEAATLRLDGQPPVGEQQDGEQDDEGDAGREPGQRREIGDVLGGQRGGDTDGDPADVGEGEAGEPAEGRGAEGLDDEEREQHGIEADRRSEEDAGRGGEDGPDDPGQAPELSGGSSR